ncbi:amino acid adenylation domain-containing protein [Longimicrobium sp.]|uniref:amino acid adenylation domain-containing protein n=1 Tax=Longimicrobium sp. TaxID=2029185 RepID=UPI002C9F115E|nr:amino acid adenylation domain-containing protein [Longimicrobium sp.]HSU14718.1 amino acid adenylation domain-containing protein [Longimicrobium sp.]
MDTINRRDTLSDAKRALLEARMRGQAHAPRQREVIGRCAGEGPEFPASYMQEQMWLAIQLDPERAIYNVPVAVLVRADADVPALERAFTEVVRRHEGLRTVFRTVGGELRQVVLPPHPVTADVRDLRAEVGPDFDAGVRRIVSEAGARTMDIERGPMVQLSLLRVSDERSALVITLQHIVTDGWAYPLILHELWELYAAELHGRPVTLPEPTLRYADYAVWQREHLRGETLDAHVAFWRGLLEGAPETELPGDRPRPAQSSYRGAMHHFVFPTEASAAVRALCRREAATVNMVLSAAFSATVARYTGSGDVVFGTLYGNRSRPELEQVVGCFVNSAALRLDLSDDPPFAEAVGRAKRLVLDAERHQELPFEKVVEHLRVRRDPSRNPLFQLMYFHHTFVPQHAQASVRELDPQAVYRAASLVDTGLAKLDFILTTLEEGDELSAIVEYATDLFDAATVERFCRHFVTLAGRAAANAHLPVSAISLLDREEEETLREWSRGPSLAAEPAPVHRQFEARAAAAPDADAVRFGAETTSYAELDARANRIARRLREMGVGPETRVGLSMERSPDLLAGVMGIWKAGGAFVPLDPAYPAERLAWTIANAALPVVVTAGDVADALPAHAAELLRIEELGDGDATAGAEEIPISADHLAYVIYTSGSTGRPKGVQVRHGSLANLLAATRDAFGAGPGDVMPPLASYAFDIWLFEALLPLVSGGATRVVPRERLLDVAALAEEAADATLLHAVPALMREIAQAERAAPRMTRLRHVFTGGDSVPPALLAEMRAAFPAAEAHVLYGPTEGTILASAHAVDGDVEGHPIGRPLAEMRLYVCDETGGLQPPGVPGELLIGGPGVARGYLGLPAMTAERFVPDPFGGFPGARLYRTGDRARWKESAEVRECGSALDPRESERTDALTHSRTSALPHSRTAVLEFQGRLDRQVKIRGFRIELGEVEAAVAGVPGVREAAVVLREDTPGVRRLVAYAAGDGVTGDAVRAALRERLPDYMVPSAVVVMDALPRTATDKLDRRALAAPEAEVGDAVEYVAPRDEVETAIAQAWARVLGRDRVGVHDNFFELGGDSILVIQTIARAAEAGVALQPWQMFRFHTVAEQAAAARDAAETAASEAASPATEAEAGDDDAFFGDGLDGIDDGLLDAVLGQLGRD